MGIDVLEALYPFKGHSLYPVACSRVLNEKRVAGVNEALSLADSIAGAFTDEALVKRLREAQ